MTNRNLLRGLFLVAIALVFGLGSLKYPTGSFERAGPGLFPLLVSSLLFLLGVVTVVRNIKIALGLIAVALFFQKVLGVQLPLY